MENARSVRQFGSLSIITCGASVVQPSSPTLGRRFRSPIGNRIKPGVYKDAGQATEARP
jgi:hypothetical protein